MGILKRRLAIAAFCALAFALAPATPALAAPTPVTLHIKGTHPVDFDRHQGTFTASPPLCPAGSWLGNGTGSRVFTCSDGSGSFAADFNGELEHVQGATGSWAITSGTGPYTALRGKGTARVDSSTGAQSFPITFSDTWTGVVVFDAVAPTGSVTSIKVVHLRNSRASWRVEIRFVAGDNGDGDGLSFFATATAGPFSESKNGTITSGTGSFRFAFRRGAGTRVLRVAIELSDPWGNKTTITKTIRLRV